MAANFWASSHANYWLVDREVLISARQIDRKYATERELGWIDIWGANILHKLCKRMGLRQQCTASAIVFFRRFYLKNSYCETEPCIVAAACCYVAAKAEEMPIHVKTVVAEARGVFAEIGHATFPSDTTKLCEMEFYLIEDLECHLIVFHPYRSLVQITGRDIPGGEALKDRKSKMLQMSDSVLQTAWWILNDTYRSQLCLLYPPYLIALAAIYLTFSLYPPGPLSTPDSPSSTSKPLQLPSPSTLRPRTRRQSTEASAAEASAQASTSSSSTTTGGDPSTSSSQQADGSGQQTQVDPFDQSDPLNFLSSLNVDTNVVLAIVQEIVSLYDLWDSLENPTRAAQYAAERDRSVGTPAEANPPSRPVTRGATNMSNSLGPDERVLAILTRMREERERDLAHPDSGRPVEPTMPPIRANDVSSTAVNNPSLMRPGSDVIEFGLMWA